MFNAFQGIKIDETHGTRRVHRLSSRQIDDKALIFAGSGIIHDVDAGAVATNDPVVAGAADKRIGACAAEDDAITCAAVNNVITKATNDDIVTLAAGDNIIAQSTDDHVIAGTAIKDVIIDDRIAIRINARGAFVRIGRHVAVRIHCRNGAIGIHRDGGSVIGQTAPDQ